MINCVFNHAEAQMLVVSYDDPVVLGALESLHLLILESVGFSNRWISAPIFPIEPLNAVSLYKIVSKLFQNWEDRPNDSSCLRLHSSHCIRVAEAISYVKLRPRIRCRSALFRFIELADSENFPANEKIDILFCCQLLDPFFSDEQALNEVLSGEQWRKSVSLSISREENPDLWH